MSKKEPLLVPIAMCSSNGFAVADTLFYLGAMSTIRHRAENGQEFYLALFHAQASNIPRGRNEVMRHIRKVVGKESGRYPMLWIDSDMGLDYVGVQHVMVMVSQLLTMPGKPVGIAMNYRTTMNGETQIRTQRTLGLTNTMYQPKGGHPYESLGREGASGFGILAINQPLDYQFHADVLGEDIYFWNDNPDYELMVYTAYMPKHVKTIPLV